jgi:hypothetical protein
MGDDARPRHPQVTASIDGFPAWQADLARRVRELIHEAEPAIVEEVRYGNRPYFLFRGSVCAMQATKDHLNVFLYDGGLAPDPHGIITDGFGNATGRQIKLYEDHALRDRPFVDLIRAIAAQNRAGGWRAVKADRPRETGD